MFIRNDKHVQIKINNDELYANDSISITRLVYQAFNELKVWLNHLHNLLNFTYLSNSVFSMVASCTKPDDIWI